MNIVKQVLIPAVAATAALAAGAVDLRPAGAFVQGGVAEHQGYSATAGVVWPWSWQHDFGSTQLTGLTEAYVAHWNARGPTGRQSYTQLGVVPIVRLRFNGGLSPWFLEGGIGVSIMDKRYQTESSEFSTKFNFVDVIGVGRNFGAGGRQELSLRLSHISNGGIKEPNPGENFLQLRYAVRL
ncbi:MAG TPA: acyloxyacyl hydrolase [Ramlibacter sp.]|nr:acyloxyacyl hydrolase [Ramlibacter sp.]